MSEKRFKSVIDEDTMSVMPYLVSDKEEECFYNLQGCVDLLNKMSDEIEEVEISIKLFEDDVQIKDKKIGEQQATIRKLQDLCGESDGENAKLRIENKRLQEEKEYWESKAMTLLLQVRRLTSRMNDKEVEEFKKELEE